MVTNFSRHRIVTLAATCVGSLAIMVGTLVPSARADTLPPEWGGDNARSSFACTTVDGVTGCAEVEYAPKTKTVVARAWAIDGRRGTNWTVNASKLQLRSAQPRRTAAGQPVCRATMGPPPVAIRRMPDHCVTPQRVESSSPDPGTDAGRDNARTAAVPATGSAYAAKAVISARSGKKTVRFVQTTGGWRRFG